MLSLYDCSTILHIFLLSYYAQWAATHQAAAPIYIAIDGKGSVSEIRDRIFAALDKQKVVN